MRTVIGTLMTVLFTGLVAFALSHSYLIGRNLYTNLMIIAMYFSGGLIPYFLLIKNLGLYNTFWVYIIPGLFGIWNCILMTNFIRSIPEALEESARIDGANDLIIFFRIIVPVSMPVIATVMLFVGVGHWNDWYTTAFYTRDRTLRTASYILKELISKANLTSVLGRMPLPLPVQPMPPRKTTPQNLCAWPPWWSWLSPLCAYIPSCKSTLSKA